MRRVFLLTIGMFTLGFDAYVMAGLLPDIGATFKIIDSQTGQAVTIFTLCFALAAPIFATLLPENQHVAYWYWHLRCSH